MSTSRTRIPKRTFQKCGSFTPSRAIPFETLKEWVKPGECWKHLFRYRGVQCQTYNLEFIPKPFFTALLLLLFSPSGCCFEDEQRRQRRITIHLLAFLFWQLIRDFFRQQSLIRRTRIAVKRLSNEYAGRKSKEICFDFSGIPVYLRTDLAFGLRSGGSLGHIAGVLNYLDSLVGKPIFLTTDCIPTVRKDLETHLISPGKEFWDYRELPSICFNENFVQDARKFLVDRKLSFVYQRYSINNYSGLQLARSYGVPFVLEYNGSEVWMGRYWTRPLKYESLSEEIEFLNLNSADLIVVVSQAMKNELMFRGINDDKILVNPNGVDPDRYSLNVDGSGVLRQYHLDGKIVIGFIGTFGKWHGAEILTEAFGKLLHKYPEYQGRVKLFMIGDGITMPLVKETVDKFAIKENCVLTGLIPQEEGPKYLAACDVLVASHKPNPDGTPFFGSPTKLFEYMAMGKGIVASDLDQIGEVLKHDHTAWLVKPGDIESLMIGLKTLIDDGTRRQRLGRAARQEVVTKYTWREHTRKIIKKLKERCA